MSGIASVCIGKRGCGKTTYSKQMLDSRPQQMPVLIYDINKEYLDYYPEEFVDFDVFLLMLSGEDIRKHYIIIEEATIFFSTRSRFEEMMNVLVRARHTGNIIQLNFHSFSSVPKNIYHLLDYVVVFKTNDTTKDITDRFDNPKVLQAAFAARDSDDPHIYKVIKLY